MVVERQLDHAYRGSLTCDANRLVLYLPEFSRVVEYKQSGSQPPRVYQFSKIAQGLIPTGFAMTPEAFRKLGPETRKLFKKHTPPVVYIPIEQPHRD